MRFAPGLGLLVASPVVLDAFRGRRGIDEALMALLIAMAAAAVAMWLLGLAIRPQPVKPRNIDAAKPGAGTRAADKTGTVS